VTRRPKSPLCDDPPVRTSLIGIRGKSFIRVEVFVALDGKAERSASFAKFAHADEADFRASHPEIAEPVSDIVVAELCQQPGALRIRRKEFDDWLEVDVRVAASLLTICSWQLARSFSVCF